MTATLDRTTIKVGQRVRCGLHWAGAGIVYEINGEQRPESCKSLGGVISMGGGASFNVVYDNGCLSKAVPESIVRGVQWEILDEIATADEISTALKFAMAEDARKRAEKQAATERREAERADYPAQYPHLATKADKPDWSDARLAAANIRIELKRDFPGVSFSVRSSHSSVRVGWTDGPTAKAVEAVTGKYQCGDFNGMEDIYEYDADNTFSDVFGGPQYVFQNRRETLEGLRRAWELAGENPADVPDDWMQGGGWKHPQHDAIQTAWCDTDLRG